MYTDLVKLFYSNKADYKTELEARINNPQAKRLDFYIGGNRAFYLPLPELFESAGKIWKADKYIYAITNGLPGVALRQFIVRSLVDEIELTNGIEGVYSSRREINDIIVDIESNDTHKRFRGIVKKYIMLIEKETLPLGTCEDIRNIFNDLVYAEIKEDDPANLPDGRIFRKSSASVTSATQKELHRGVNPEESIISAIERALSILHDEEINIFFRIAAFHYFFGYIHPFYDGNGRTSRFISSYLLSKELEPIIGYRLSYMIHENLKEYYKAFETCNHPANCGDITPFLIMFIGIVEKSMELLKGALETSKNEYETYRAEIPELCKGTDKKYAEIYDLLIQASLFSDEGIPLRDLLSVLGISRQTLRDRLHGLDKDLLMQRVIAGEKYYLLNVEKLSQIAQRRISTDNHQISLF